MNAVPVSVALVAGGLAVINPCGFPLLPAFLSFYLGADENTLPRAPTRIMQGLLVGALVSIGFLGLFALASLPVSFGVALVARAVPWAGLATGALLALRVLVRLAREGVARAVRPALPYMSRIAGVLLVIAGGYLVYYWARLRFGDTATVADDPIVSFAFRFTGHIRTFADGRGSTLIAVAAGIVVVALIAAFLRWRRQTTATGLVSE